MDRFASLILVFASLTAAHAADQPMPAAEAAARMTLPPGFRATLFAGEPDIVQPIAFTFDDRGRLWVIENHSYPKWSRDGTGHDKVIIFEDTDGDGRFDKRTVVLDNGSNLSGIEYGFGGIFLCSAPKLIHIPIKDDKPAGPATVLLDGWNLDLGHNMFNGLAWGPDGWLYGCHGITVTSHIGKPGCKDGERVPFNCGVWRYHPTRHVFEPFAWGMTNPWGLDWTADGELFATNCVIKHLFHVIPGGHYERMFGQDLNPHVYKLMESCADHLHWGGGHWTSSRTKSDGTVKPEHDDAGGGHAHSGCMIYLGDNWPAEYRGDVFTLNLHGRRVNRDKLERKGSGFVAKHGKDTLFAADPWFRGLALKYGPDGGVFITDWSDTGECHNYDKADRTNGRIFKVTFGTPKPWSGDLAKLSDDELLKLQAHPNEWFGRHARRLLQERYIRTPMSWRNTWQVDPLRRLWICHAGMSFDEFAEALRFPFPAVRAWAVRLYFDATDAARSRIFEVAKRLIAEESPEVWLAAASALRRYRYAATDLYPGLVNRDWADDPNVALAFWYSVEPSVAANPEFAASAFKLIHTPFIRELIARRAAELPGSLDLVANCLPSATDAARQRDILAGLTTALGDRRHIEPPERLRDAAKQLSYSPSDEVRRLARRLSVVFGEPSALTATIDAIADRAVPDGERLDAFDLLAFKQPVDFWGVARGRLTDPLLRGRALRALAGDPNLRPSDILPHYATLTDAEKADAVATLASRPALAAALLDAVAAGTIPRKDVSAFTVRQLGKLKDKALSQRVTAVWGESRPAAQDKIKRIAEFKNELTPDVLTKADLGRGRALFKQHCASCHKLHGDGGTVGPELTGSQRANLDYILENVLDPSALVASEYQVTDVLTKSGRLVSGIVAAESALALTLQTPTEKVVVPLADIATREKSAVSIMPEGVLETLTRDERRDLVAYLAK